MRYLLLFYYCVFIAIVTGADIEVSNWVPIDGQEEIPSMNAIVGDTIIFKWSEGIFDVFIHPSGNCEEDEAILIGYTSGSSYTFKEDDSGKELFFACDVGQRCEAGQNMKVTVSSKSMNMEIDSIENTFNSAAYDPKISGNILVFSSLVLASGFFTIILI